MVLVVINLSFAESVFKILYAWNIAFIFTIRVQYHEWKRKQKKNTLTDFDDTSK